MALNDLDPALERYVSALVEQQFPAVYRDLGPVFVAFVKAYYEWLESEGNPQWYARRWLDLNDVDTTTDQFLIYFKQKYLKNIQLETTSDVQMMIKHSLDIYRSKGSPQSIDLLFRLVFGVGADVYFPRTDLMTLSSGNWVVPKYLEVSSIPYLGNTKFVGREIIGLNSRATAFVERFVRKKIGTTFVEVLYISAINGAFQTGEKINTTNNPFDYSVCPVVIGSLTTLTVVDGGIGFDVGDAVPLTGAAGAGAIGRVTAISNTVGLVSYTLVDGGWGFTNDTEIFVSSAVLTVNNMIAANTFSSNHYFGWFETLVQPYAEMNYINSNGTFAVGANVYTYGSPPGLGQILANVPANTSAGLLTVSVLSGNLQNLAIFTQGNAAGANLTVSNGYIDLTTTASVIAEQGNVYLTTSGSSGSFQIGEQVSVVATPAINAYVLSQSLTGNTGIIRLQNAYSMFQTGQIVTGALSGATATVNTVSVIIGVVQVNGQFTTIANNFIYGGNNLSNGTLTNISGGTGTTVNVSSVLSNVEADDICCELIAEIGNTIINATTYATSNGGNGASIISTTVQHGVQNVGSLTALIDINPGTDYTFSPIVRAYDPCIYAYKRRGMAVTYVGATAAFIPGEAVTQASSGANGIVLASSNSSMLFLKRQSLNASYLLTTNVATQIIGQGSGAVANVVGTGVDWTIPDSDIDQIFCGLNAEIDATTTVGTGAAATLSVIDSGFAYQDGEVVSYESSNGVIGTAQVHLGRYGVGAGYYTDRNGFLSSEKKIFDGNYWQNFSYEIRSSLAIEVYEDMLKKILHIAGMKYFGALYHNVNVQAPITAAIAEIDIVAAPTTITSENYPFFLIPTDVY
jgi:hypothetical protein